LASTSDKTVRHHNYGGTVIGRYEGVGRVALSPPFVWLKTAEDEDIVIIHLAPGDYLRFHEDNPR
jgi:hypothetical protein